MDHELLHKLIERIVAEVVRRVALEERRKQHPERVLVLLAAPVAYPEALLETLQRQFGVGYTLVSFQDDCGLREETMLSASSMAEGALLQRVTQAGTVILVAPHLELLKQIAAGDDRTPLAHLMIRSILWQKDVRLYLDFEPPRFRRNTFLEGVADAVETLRQMNATVCPYYTGDSRTPEGAELVTEADVLTAAQTEHKTIRCRNGAIITPAARDALAESGVILRYEGEKPCNLQE